MKIGFLGLCAFGMEYLKHMLEKGYEIAFASTKHNVQPHVTDLEQECIDLCKEKGILYLGNVDVNTDKMIERISQVDVVIMGGYDKILKESFISASKVGIFNTHLSLIPTHRGCYPVIWSILCDDVAGFTTYQVNADIDTGVIYCQEKTDILPGETAEVLYARLCQIVIEKYPETLERILAKDPPEITPIFETTVYHKSGMPNDRWVSWQWKGEMLSRFSRCLTFLPYPGPRTRIADSQQEIPLYIREIDISSGVDQPGIVLDVAGDHFLVSCSDGVARCQLREDRDKKYLKNGICLESVAGEKHPIPVDYSEEKLKFY